MKRTLKFLSVVCSFAALPLAVRAQSSAATDPVGYVTITTLSNSDTIFATPLAQPEVFRGAIGTLSSTTITATGTPGFTPSAFVYVAGSQSNTFYLRFRSGAKAGFYYTITANTANSVTINLAGDLLTGAAPGDQFAILPYWTLGTVLPASGAGTAFQASTGFVRNTQIYFPDQSSQGVNLASATSFYFSNSAWRKVGALATVSFNDTVLPPDSYVTIRNRAFTGTITVMGGVVTTPQSTPLNAFASAAQDNFVAVSYPVDTTLNNLGLSAAVVPTNDVVFVFDNTVPGINRKPSATYFFLNGAWREAGQNPTTDFGTDVIKAGSGFIVRKAANGSGPNTTDWVYTP